MSQIENNEQNTQERIIPKLRFPEFQTTLGWEVTQLKFICDVLQGNVFPEALQGKKSGKYPFFKVSDISRSIIDSNGHLSKAANYVDEGDVSKLKAKMIPKNSTVFAKIGEALRLNRRAYTQSECLIDNNIAALKATGKANDYFVYQLSQLIDLNNYFAGAVPSVNKSTLENIEISFPEIKEQQKVADCLSSIDELINLREQKLAALKQHKKGLMQQLFPSHNDLQASKQAIVYPKLRFPQFKDCKGWRVVKLGNVFKRITLKNKENNQNVLTISAQYGLISQLDFFNKSVAAKNITGYYLLHKGDFGYNKSYSNGYPWGAIKPLKLYDKGVVSTLYICFRLQELYLEYSSFFEHYFETGLQNPEISQIAQEGARNHGLLNVSVQDFFENISICLPSSKEQQAIADCLSSLDRLIDEEKEQIGRLKDHKKGLMQQLFPIFRN